jgi:hypothetical protein
MAIRFGVSLWLIGPSLLTVELLREELLKLRGRS